LKLYIFTGISIKILVKILYYLKLLIIKINNLYSST
jgi:hypothetical protein